MAGAPYFSSVGSAVGKRDCRWKCADIRVARLLDQKNHRLCLLTKVGTQGKRAVIVQPLVTGPTNGVAHSLYLDLRFKFQSLPIGDVRKHKLGLPNLARHRITGVQTTAL